MSKTAIGRRAGVGQGAGSMTVIGAFLLAGLVWGVVARAWMRLVSGDPEFSSSGTSLVVGLFAVVGTAQGIALAVRRCRWPRWAQTIVRVVAAGAALLLGGGAGIVMLPALVTGSLAWARSDWTPWVRVGVGSVAVLNTIAMLAMLHVDISWTRAIVGWVLMLPLYGVIIGAISLNLRPVPRPVRTDRPDRAHIDGQFAPAPSPARTLGT